MVKVVAPRAKERRRRRQQTRERHLGSNTPGNTAVTSEAGKAAAEVAAQQ